MPDINEVRGVIVTTENLMTPAAFYTLGALAAKALQAVGNVTLVVRPDRAIAYANPAKVHIMHDAVPDATLLERPFHYVRPILSDGKPQFVGWHGGKLWEVEFDEVDVGQEGEGNQSDQ